MSKKQWEKPKLIVLVRANEQENVLLTCKDTFRVGQNTGFCTTGGGTGDSKCFNLGAS